MREVEDFCRKDQENFGELWKMATEALPMVLSSMIPGGKSCWVSRKKMLSFSNEQ